MKDSELLELAKVEISASKNWTQHYFARDSLDNPADIHDEDACKFCSMGAVHKALYRRDGIVIPTSRFSDSSRMFELLRRAVWVLKEKRSIDKFNDAEDTKHEDVLDVFDLAITMAKQKEKDDKPVPSVS